MTAYTINTIDSETRQRWMDCPAVVRYTAGLQDSGYCRFRVVVSDAREAERAFILDDDVVEYDRLDEDADADRDPRRMCAHQVKHSRDVCYDGTERDTNPMATGGITVIDTCACGAERRTNVNGQHVASGLWEA